MQYYPSSPTRSPRRKELSRTAAAASNLQASVAGIFINLIFSFFSRKIFVMILGKEFVGLGSLVGNMTAVLSLLDFGASSAVIYRLYSPLAEKSYASVSAYLAYYRRLCRLSAVLTVVAGFFIMPHLPDMVESFDDTRTLYAVFFIYLIGNAIGYIFSAERILLFADQKNYISQIFSYLFGAVTVLCESAVLYVTRNYVIYLAVHTVLCFTEDAVLAAYVRKKYTELCFRSDICCDKEHSRALRREMLLLQPSNIAGTLLRTADNFLVVYLFGVAVNGIYSNYNMLLGYASMLSVTLIGAISASVGNLSAEASPERAEEVFGITGLASFFLINICTTLLFVMSDDIITVWLDSSLALPFSVSCILASHFFISGMRRTVMMFRDGYGLYRKEKLKPFVELAASLALSVLFGKKIGLGGVYLGQALSAFFICMWYEPYLLYKHGFGKSVTPYFFRMMGYIAVTATSCLCSLAVCRYIHFFSLRAVTCTAIPSLFFFAAFSHTDDMKKLLSKLSRYKKSTDIALS